MEKEFQVVLVELRESGVLGIHGPLDNQGFFLLELSTQQTIPTMRRRREGPHAMQYD